MSYEENAAAAIFRGTRISHARRAQPGRTVIAPTECYARHNQQFGSP
jgi:hypothetical protein